MTAMHWFWGVVLRSENPKPCSFCVIRKNTILKVKKFLVYQNSIYMIPKPKTGFHEMFPQYSTMFPSTFRLPVHKLYFWWLLKIENSKNDKIHPKNPIIDQSINRFARSFGTILIFRCVSFKLIVKRMWKLFTIVKFPQLTLIGYSKNGYPQNRLKSLDLDAQRCVLTYYMVIWWSFHKVHFRSVPP